MGDLLPDDLSGLSDADIGIRLAASTLNLADDGLTAFREIGLPGSPVNALAAASFFASPSERNKARAVRHLEYLRELDFADDDSPMMWGFERALRLAGSRQFARAGRVYRTWLRDAHVDGETWRQTVGKLKEFADAQRERSAQGNEAKTRERDRLAQLADEIAAAYVKELSASRRARLRGKALASEVFERLCRHERDAGRSFDRRSETVRQWLTRRGTMKRLLGTEE